MDTLLNLEQLALRLKQVDRMLMTLIKRRMDLALEVGNFKRREKLKIVRLDIEDRRIAEVKELAVELGINPHLVAAILYLLIDESCKSQADLLQQESLRYAEPETEDQRYERLKKNLLLLTERWCNSYDSDYEKHAFATKAYIAHERALMKKEIEQLPSGGIAIDLGCATGSLTLAFGEYFEHMIGYDISPHMITVAQTKASQHISGARASFHEEDIEKCIPIADATASFVVMNLGTASDVRNIKGVIDETVRILKPGGRFLFSFYNREALLYRWEFLPWSVGLVASINLHKHCLDVHSRNEVLSVYARPYTMTEVAALFHDVGVEASLWTYPTMSAILPNDLFEDHSDIQEAVTTIDEGLASSSMGAYIIATGQK